MGTKFGYRDQRQICHDSPMESPAAAFESIVWISTEEWWKVKTGSYIKRIRDDKWPMVEKTLILWVTRETADTFTRFMSDNPDSL